jgi:alkylation response protein AidB-like acyl-CoA dehydrogenase
MHLRWNEHQNDLRSHYSEIGKGAKRRLVEPGASPELDTGTWKELAAQGFFGLATATRYGGSGETWWEFAAAFEGLSSTVGDLGFLLSIIAQMGAIRIISERGSDEQRRHYLPMLVEGRIAATAATEAAGGSDVSRVRSATSGKHRQLRLNGTKTHITNAPIAEVFIILGRDGDRPPKQDITLFVIERGTGVKTSLPETTLGNRNSPTGDIFLQDALISPMNVLGVPGDGLSALYSMLTIDRLLYAIAAAGYLEPIIVSAFERAHARTSFGRRLHEHQYIQEKLVLLKTSMEQARYLAYAALDHLLAGSEEASSLGSIAKLVGTEGLFQASYEYLQLFGHFGYMDGDVSRFLRDAVGTRIAGGTSEMQKVNIFKQELKRFLKQHESYQPEATVRVHDATWPDSRAAALGR